MSCQIKHQHLNIIAIAFLSRRIVQFAVDGMNVRNIPHRSKQIGMTLYTVKSGGGFADSSDGIPIRMTERILTSESTSGSAT